jgi:prophage antirepressor-like protein
MSEVIPFSFDGTQVRTVVLDGEPWFVGKDVAERLGYADPTTAIRSHCRGVQKLHPIPDSLGRAQNIRILSEPDVLRLIIGSTLPDAARFERWVFEEVLPAIRRDGGYMVAAPEETPEALALRALKVLYATVERQKVLLEVAQPKADALDRIADAEGSHCITDAAKLLQVRPKSLFAYLDQHGWTYRRVGSDHRCAYQERIVGGDLVHKVTTVLRPDGSEKTTEQVRVTPRGLTKLAKLLPPAVKLVATSVAA